MTQQIQLRRDTAANWDTHNPTLLSGEIGIETDTLQFKIGDGSTAWTSLSYFSSSFTSNANASRILLTAATGQSIPTGTGWTDIDLTTTTTNTGVAGFTISLANNTLTCTRAGTYNLAGLIHYAQDSGTNGITTEFRMLKNGVAITNSTVTATHYVTSSNASHKGSAPGWRTPSNTTLAVGDVIKIQGRHGDAGSVNITKAWLGAYEIFAEGYDLQRFDPMLMWWNFPNDTPTVEVGGSTYAVDGMIPECSTSTSWQFPGETFTCTTIAQQQFEATPFRRPNLMTFQLVENHIAAGTTEVQLWAQSQEFGVSSNVVDTTPTRTLIKTASVNDSGRTNNTFSLSSTEITTIMSIPSRFGLSFHLRFRSADGVGQTRLQSVRLLSYYR